MRAVALALALTLAAGPAAFSAGPALSLPLETSRNSASDLEIRGMLRGVPSGGAFYVRVADLEALPASKVKVSDEFHPGPQELSILFLGDLLRALPVLPGADVVIATCNDQYASVYRFDFIAKYRPYFVLAIDGFGPDRWPPPGATYNPGPFAILVSPEVVPEAAHFLDLPHKKPWGVVSIEIGRYADFFHDAYAGRWAVLSPRAGEGRVIWVNSCASCHQGPGATFGGTKSGQPFAALAAIAAGDPSFLKKYVRNPQAVNPSAKMEAHPHYSEAQLDAVIAFILAEGPAAH